MDEVVKADIENIDETIELKEVQGSSKIEGNMLTLHKIKGNLGQSREQR